MLEDVSEEGVVEEDLQDRVCIAEGQGFLIRKGGYIFEADEELCFCGGLFAGGWVVAH